MYVVIHRRNGALFLHRYRGNLTGLLCLVVKNKRPTLLSRHVTLGWFEKCLAYRAMDKLFVELSRRGADITGPFLHKKVV